MREFELLEQVFRHNGRLPSFVELPPGDDMAVLRMPDSRLLVAADQVIEGRHFRAETRPGLVARKAVTRNLSDVAAMAARPWATLATVALPGGYGDARSIELIEGLRSSAEVFGCPLVGGDLAVHAHGDGPLTVGVAILAVPATRSGRVVARKGSRIGDGVYVTGTLGGSLRPDGGGTHLTFEPRVPEAIELLEALGDSLHAMIDLSDGLGRDAAHLAGDPALAIEFDVGSLPLTAGIAWRAAIAGGEDYELLFTASRAPPTVLSGGTRVTRVGTVCERRDAAVVAREGAGRTDVSRFGWEHGP